MLNSWQIQFMGALQFDTLLYLIYQMLRFKSLGWYWIDIVAKFYGSRKQQIYPGCSLEGIHIYITAI